MEPSIKIIIDSNPNYKLYLRNNSYWYKILFYAYLIIGDFCDRKV